MYQPSAPPTKQPEFDEELWDITPDEDESIPDAVIMTPEVGRYAMEQAIARLLFHTGFEGYPVRNDINNRLPSISIRFNNWRCNRVSSKNRRNVGFIHEL